MSSGYIENQNIHIEWRWGRGSIERFPEFADEMARLNVDVIVVGNDVAGRAAQRATNQRERCGPYQNSGEEGAEGRDQGGGGGRGRRLVVWAGGDWGGRGGVEGSGVRWPARAREVWVGRGGGGPRHVELRGDIGGEDGMRGGCAYGGGAAGALGGGGLVRWWGGISGVGVVWREWRVAGGYSRELGMVRSRVSPGFWRLRGCGGCACLCGGGAPGRRSSELKGEFALVIPTAIRRQQRLAATQHPRSQSDPEFQLPSCAKPRSRKRTYVPDPEMDPGPVGGAAGPRGASLARQTRHEALWSSDAWPPEYFRRGRRFPS